MAKREGVIQAGWWLVFSLVYLQSPLPVLGDSVVNSNATFTANYKSGSDWQHLRVLNDGSRAELILDKASASGFSSKHKYLFGRIGMRMKLVPGNSAGTVTAYYMASQTNRTDELDFEFLGNVSGEPYILQTNVFAGGKGGREQRIFLWFDPTADFHEYSVLWNTRQIVFYVDDTPIRVFGNYKQRLGTAYLDSQPVQIFSSIWNGDNWATKNGWVKLNWSYAPFVATYEKFSVDACLVTNDDSEHCVAAKNNWWEGTQYQTLGTREAGQLNWVKNNFVVYNYCTDQRRNPTPPAECELNVL